MAKEYISREDVCLQLEKQESIDGQPRAIRRARRIVAEFPAADVVPVVRCGECVHWERYDNTAGCGYCHKVKFEYGANGYVFNPVREPDFYCADGKRKDGGVIL